MVFAYAAGIEPVPWHAVTLMLKLCLFALAPGWPFTILARNFPALAYLIGAYLISILLAQTPLADVARLAGFAIHLLLSLAILRPGRWRAYAKAGAYTLAAGTLIYLASVAGGRIENRWGRLMYFGVLHPNLGAELMAVSVVLAGLSMSWWRTLGIGALSLAAVVPMQGRAAIVAIVATMAVRFFFAFNPLRSRVGLGALAAVVLAGVVGGYVYHDEIWSRLDEALLLSDARRGVDTGVSGRDSRWAIGIEAFQSSPWTGVGPGVFGGDTDTPHSFWLYGLAELGLMSAPLFLMIAWKGLAICRRSMVDALVLGSTVVMLTFNDRFLAINPYPMMLIVVVLCYGVEPRRRAGGDRLSPAGHPRTRAAAGFSGG